MKEHIKSICKTCRFSTDCSLTTNMQTVSSCSEYWHYRDTDNELAFMVSIEMIPTSNEN
ncbi:unnamed protein product, partial [Ectocarpus sp. 12 AP-2014]